MFSLLGVALPMETLEAYWFALSKPGYFTKILISVCVAAALSLVFFWRRSSARKSKLDHYRKAAQAHRDRQLRLIDQFIKKNPAPPEATSRQILEASATTLVENMTSGHWKVETVMLTYCHKAISVHSQLNCLTEIMFEAALKKAREMDSNPEKTGILFGVPVSIKDNIHVKNVPSSAGVFRWKDEVISANSSVVDYLESQGAIPFCKTNVPQTMMTFECRNPLWGMTENPHKPGFSPGGSSGGEAALIGAGGSVLGIGSDIAGSLRIPAHFSGICAIKPSNNRIPSTGCRAFKHSLAIIHPVVGPMARNVDDLRLVLEACLGKQDMDNPPSTFAMPQQNDQSRKLKFGVIKDLSYLRALPPCTRAVEGVVADLEAAGYEVVPFDFPFKISVFVSLLYRILAADSGHFYRHVLRDEPIEDSVAPFMTLLSRPKLFLHFYRLIAKMYPDPRPLEFLNALGAKDAIDIMEMLGERDSIRSQLDEAWKRCGIDALLMPAFACPASPQGAFPCISFAAVYTYMWNIVDYVAGVVPVSKVDLTLDAKSSRLSEEDFDATKSTRLLEAELDYIYDPVKMEGLPIGVQIITPQYRESEAILAMKIVEKTVKK